jgi:hypothetical protein
MSCRPTRLRIGQFVALLASLAITLALLVGAGGLLEPGAWSGPAAVSGSIYDYDTPASPATTTTNLRTTAFRAYDRRSQLPHVGRVAILGRLAAEGGGAVARNLAEKLSLDEAKGGAGRRIMLGKINDRRYPENVWAKMQHVHRHPDGTQTVIHYWENLQTGAREGFKFK